jgi:transposase
MIALSWGGLRTAEIACHLRCHPQTVRERFERFRTEGIDGLTNRPGAGRKTRLTERERSQLVALVAQTRVLTTSARNSVNGILQSIFSVAARREGLCDTSGGGSPRRCAKNGLD